MARTDVITAEYARQLFRYDPETGKIFCINAWRGWKAGREAGRATHDGYRRLGVDRKQYYAHHIAWLMHYGEWPQSQIDHVNGDRSDNRISNLRLCNQSQNVANARIGVRNKTGFKGVSVQGSAFAAFIKVNGKSKYLGRYGTPERAHAAYMSAAKEAFKEFARSR